MLGVPEDQMATGKMVEWEQKESCIWHIVSWFSLSPFGNTKGVSGLSTIEFSVERLG